MINSSNRYFLVSGTIFAAFLALPASLTWAQTAPGNGAGPVEVAPPVDTSKAPDDATLQHAARAFVKVRQIAQGEQNAAKGAPATSSTQSMMQQAESQKVNVVQAEGLKADDYNHVLLLVQNDPALRERFMSYVKQDEAAENSE